MNLTEEQIIGQVALFMWPLMRISAMFISMPLFSIKSVPARVRLIFSVVITLVVMPLLPPLPAVDMFSYSGLMVAMTQIMIGLTTGFILQLVFAAVVFAGQGVALSMGLGFSMMVDPQSGQQMPVIAQFYTITTTLIFISLDGHLVLIQMLLDSFKTLPIGFDGIDKAAIWSILAWSSRMFAGGLLLAMPIIASLLLVNIIFGVAARSAPQLQIFAVGFPVTLMLGMVLVWRTLPDVLDQFSGQLTDGYDFIGQLLRL
ncbi:MAG: flagellar biosynthetic protein FliR [Methylococcales bacterium]|nr:flagellar biosynthetic protein FliR [Methylobacter sp.]MDP2428425.1 flagellar biosynthetic protein FliR [Methylobacter sp.]MDP3056650.1 flagellar biosynthetic protein FliR [Methylobacter sp.]MDP3362181.1 flagellar biosynthetic protein FliR [Methylobacter sp.]MDZ4157156.1 flagellar biosynthetic protein FliR [Methylococcales bacterium]